MLVEHGPDTAVDLRWVDHRLDRVKEHMRQELRQGPLMDVTDLMKSDIPAP